MHFGAFFCINMHVNKIIYDGEYFESIYEKYSIVFTDKLVHYTTGDNIGSPGGQRFEFRQVHTVNTVYMVQ